MPNPVGIRPGRYLLGPMAAELNPEQIRAVGFRTVRRGLDPDEVSAFLQRIAATMEKLESDRSSATTTATANASATPRSRRAAKLSSGTRIAICEG